MSKIDASFNVKKRTISEIRKDLAPEKIDITKVSEVIAKYKVKSNFDSSWLWISQKTFEINQFGEE